jgi:hypothetical protein
LRGAPRRRVNPSRDQNPGRRAARRGFNLKTQPVTTKADDLLETRAQTVPAVNRGQAPWCPVRWAKTSDSRSPAQHHIDREAMTILDSAVGPTSPARWPDRTRHPRRHWTRPARWSRFPSSLVSAHHPEPHLNPPRAHRLRELRRCVPISKALDTHASLVRGQHSVVRTPARRSSTRSDPHRHDAWQRGQPPSWS